MVKSYFYIEGCFQSFFPNYYDINYVVDKASVWDRDCIATFQFSWLSLRLIFVFDSLARKPAAAI